MSQKIRGSDVYVVEDIERILSALAGASRRYSGEYGAGYADALRDVAAGVGATVDDMDRVDVVDRMHEVVEYRAERTVERYRPAAAERYQAGPPQVARQAPADMTGDDVNVTLFNPACGRLVAREVGYGWIGNDGHTAFWNASDWQRVPIEDARAWGELVPDDWAVLVRHAYANEKRRQLAAGQRGMLR